MSNVADVSFTLTFGSSRGRPREQMSAVDGCCHSCLNPRAWPNSWIAYCVTQSNLNSTADEEVATHASEFPKALISMETILGPGKLYPELFFASLRILNLIYCLFSSKNNWSQRLNPTNRTAELISHDAFKAFLTCSINASKGGGETP
jgi:hypothetical protein